MIQPYQASPAVTLARRRDTASRPRGAASASLLALAVGLAVCASAQAANTNLTRDGEWFELGIWDNNVPTGVNNFAYVDGHALQLQTPGADSWHLYLASTADAQLEINGGTLQTATATLGVNAGRTGSALISGVGSSWIINYDIGVGHFGQGQLVVSNGGYLYTKNAWVGSQGGSEGFVAVAGTGVWEADTIYAGASGKGHIELISGGKIDTDNMLVGAFATGDGLMVVNGTGSQLDTGTLQVGAAGKGELLVQAGGRLDSGSAVIGGSGGQGLVTLTGATSQWVNRGLLTLGNAGTGNFIVDSGATARIDGSIVLGAAGSGAGSLKVGNNSVLTVGTAMGPQSISTGSGSGHIELAGGVLRNPGWLTVSSDVLVSADSQLDTVGNLGLQGVISGSGLLRKTGAGVLMLSGNNTFDGGLQIDAGTLSLNGAAAAGRGVLTLGDGTSLGLVNMSSLDNSVRLLGNTGVWVASGDSVTLTGGLNGTASSVLEKNDGGELVLSNGAFAGLTRVNAGTVRAIGNAMPGGDIEIGSNGTFQTDTTRVVTYGGRISGAGLLRQGRQYLGLTGDSSGFTGTTWVSEGQLEVNGLLGGQLKLDNTAWLSGSGTVGSVQLLSGSTLSPGSTQSRGVGRLSVSGDLLFDASAVYRVDVAADGSSDHVEVAGKATLGQASSMAVAAAGDWKPSTRYTVLSAAGGVAGTFSGVRSTLAFLDPTLEYDARNVYLTMKRNDVSMPDVGLAFPDVVVNPNQKAVAGAVEALGNGNAVYEAVVRLDVADVVPAFDSLSGEIHAANRGALLQNRFLHDGINRHLDGAALAGQIAPGVRVWLAGSGSQRRTDDSAENAGLRSSQHGMLAGAGWTFGDALELGVAAGRQQLVSRLAGRDARAETDSTEYGVYGQYRWQGLGLRAGVSRADYRTDSTRTAQVGSTLSEGLAAREDATGTTAFLRAGWTFGGPRLQLTPELELAQVRLRSDGAQERGGHSALQLEGETARYRTGLAALRADWDISGGQRDRAALTARVGWQVAGGDRLPQVAARFVEGTQDFGIAAAPLARRSVLAQLGVAVSPTDNSRLSLQMQGQRGDGQRAVGAQLDLSVAF